MATPAPALLTIEQLARLIPTLHSRGYQVVGPAVRDGAIVYDVVEKLSELRGWNPDQTREMIFENFLRLAGADEWVQRLRGVASSRPAKPILTPQ